MRLGIDRAHLKAWIEERAERDEDTGCLVWKQAGAHGGKEPQGRYLGSVVLVRRAVMQAQRGKPVPTTVSVKPRCETPGCVEESHMVPKLRAKLRVGSKLTMAQRANIANAVRECKRAKLTLEAVEDIRTKQEKREVYAQRYGIAKEYVNDIQGYAVWRDFASPFAGLLA